MFSKTDNIFAAYKQRLQEKNPCWDGYKKVPGKADYEDDSCVKEDEAHEGYRKPTAAEIAADKKKDGKKKDGDRHSRIKGKVYGKAMGGLKDDIEENNDLVELSTKTLQNYVKKASDAKGHKNLSTKKVDNRYAGVSRANKKLNKRNEENEDIEEAGYLDHAKTKDEVDAKNVTDEPKGDSRDTAVVAKEDVKAALQELKIKKLDKDTIEMLKSLDDDEARMIIQGLPSSLRRKAMKELGLKEKVDGRTKGYKETVGRLTAKKKVQESDESDGSTAEKEPTLGKNPGKTFKISFESINRPNEKKILDFLSKHERMGNIDLLAQEEQGLTFKVVDEDAVRGLHLELRKFKVAAQEVTKEDASADAEDEFHKDLDKLVHKTFGKSSDEVKEDTAQLEEKRAFIFAAAKAKANGEKKFIFNGKEYNVKLKNGPIVEADPVEEEEESK